MADLSEIFSSLSKEDMENLKSVAQNLLSSNTKAESVRKSEPPKAQTNNNQQLMDLLSHLPKDLQKETESTKFLRTLKPLLSSERQKKVDEALEFLHLMDALPLMKGLL